MLVKQLYSENWDTGNFPTGSSYHPGLLFRVIAIPGRPGPTNSCNPVSWCGSLLSRITSNKPASFIIWDWKATGSSALLMSCDYLASSSDSSDSETLELFLPRLGELKNVSGYDGSSELLDHQCIYCSSMARITIVDAWHFNDYAGKMIDGSTSNGTILPLLNLTGASSWTYLESQIGPWPWSQKIETREWCIESYTRVI